MGWRLLVFGKLLHNRFLGKAGGIHNEFIIKFKNGPKNVKFWDEEEIFEIAQNMIDASKPF